MLGLCASTLQSFDPPPRAPKITIAILSSEEPQATHRASANVAHTSHSLMVITIKERRLEDLAFSHANHITVVIFQFVLNNGQVSEKRPITVVSQHFFARTAISITQTHRTLSCEQGGRILERSGQRTEGTRRRREREYYCWAFIFLSPNATITCRSAPSGATRPDNSPSATTMEDLNFHRTLFLDLRDHDQSSKFEMSPKAATNQMKAQDRACLMGMVR